VPSQVLEVSSDYVVEAGTTIVFLQDGDDAGQPISLYNTPLTPAPSFTNNGILRYIVTRSVFDITEFINPVAGSAWINSVITNNGTMEATSSIGHLRGIYSATWTPSFVNTGTFSVTAVGEALGYYAAHDGTVLPIYVRNSGSLLVDGQAGGIGIFLTAGSITNSGLIRVTGALNAAAAGISTRGMMDLNNSGSIIVDDRSTSEWAVGVAWVAAAENRIVNSGLIQADIALQATDADADGYPAPGATILNTGRIVGKVELGRGSDVLVNSDSINGDTALGGGDDTYDGRLGVLVGTLDGGDGDDILLGGSGIETLVGGAGVDRLSGGGGADLLTGGAGGDLFVVETGGGADVVTDFAVGVDKIDIVGGGAVVSTVQQGADTLITFQGGGTMLLRDVSAATVGADSFITTAAPIVVPVTASPPPPPAVIMGTAGPDRLRGGNGPDLLIGGDGDDVITGGSNGENTVRPGSGNDIAEAGTGYDTLDYSDAVGG